VKHRLFLFALAALVPLIALAAGLTFYSLHQQQAALRDEATHHVSGILDAVERELLSQTDVLRGLATSLSLDQASFDLQRFHAQASRFVEELRHWDVIVLADLEGRQLANTRFPFGATLPGVFDDWSYRRVIEAREPVIGNVSGPGPFAADRIPVVNIRVPVLRDGSLRHVLTATVSARPLSAMIARGIDPQWRAFLIDGAGRIAAAAHRLEAIGQRPSEQTLAARAASKQGLYEGLTLDGLRTVTAFQMSERTGWSAHVSIPQDLYNAPLVRSLWFLGASVLAALALTLIFIEFLRREALNRERTLDQLQTAEQRFRDFAELGSDWFWETDADYRITQVAGQPTAVPVLGKTRWEAAGGDPNSPEWKDHVALVHAHKPFHSFEYKADLIHQTFYLETSGRPRFNAAGQFLGYRGVTTNVTVRRGAELAAAEQSGLLQATLDNMDQGLIMIDSTGVVQVCNRRAVELLDLPPDYTHSKPGFSDFLKHQVSIGEFAGFNEEEVPWLRLKGNLLSAPPLYERTRPNGTTLEVRTVHLPDGTAVRTFTDITTRKKGEAELKDSEARFRDYADIAADWLWELDDQFRFTRVTGRRPDAFGQPVSHMVGRTARALLSAHSLEPLESEMVDRMRAREPFFSVEMHVRRPDGEDRWFTSSGKPIFGPEGSFIGYRGASADVTARRRAEQALRQSQEELRAALDANRSIFEHSQDVICTTDQDGAFTQVSPQALKIWGYLPQDLIGRRYMDFVHPEDHEKTIAVAEKIMSGTPTTGFENRYIRRDGSTVPILWSAVWSGEHRTMYCVARDLSERLQLEEQLRQAQKMEAVGQLTGGIAHDFNNLLTVILGNAEVLTEDPTDPALTYNLARQILETAERGADLNQKLLAFGRRQTLRPERTKVGRVIENMVPLLYRTIGEHIELETELADTSDLAIVDRSLLESAVLNLAVNARDAMPQGGTLTIASGQRVASHGEGSLPIGQPVVFIRVSDTGTGMSPEVMAQAFEPFFTTKEVGKGSGLGLSMVFGFAQQSAGHVGIESKVGLGTAVTIVLPAVTGEVDQPSHQQVLEPVSAAKKASILVVEDEPQVLQFVSAQLVGLGYEVAAVSTGQDALDLLEQGRTLDVLFTDVVLPKGVSGVELARRVRAIRPGIKVLLTSGYPEDVFEQHGGREQSTPLLHKPYRRKELVEALQGILEPSPASA
jgi:PAS domain S-box-containing protein